MLISPKDITIKAERLWNNNSFQKSWLNGESLFPYFISFKKPTGKLLIENFAEVRTWLTELKSHSKETLGSGYSIVYEQINHRQLGRQEVPVKIIIESENDFLKLIKKEKAFHNFKTLVAETMERLPKLQQLLLQNPSIILDYDNEWSRLLTVCEYFIKNPNPGIYIRQIDIPGIDTKFIESYMGVLRDMLDTLFNTHTLNKNITSLSHHGFERSFGLTYDEPLIRFRLLDPHMNLCGMTDISLPVSEFNQLSIQPKNVFITENKINGLAFPHIENSIVLFGLGYGIQSVKDTEWLKKTNIYYWGDIDTHGFRILSMARSLFETCVSLLMDRETFLAFKDLCTSEDPHKRFLGALDNLTEDESLLYNDLQTNKLGENIRLEQERIAYQYVCDKVTAIITSSLS